jgi:hypothetical protein
MLKPVVGRDDWECGEGLIYAGKNGRHGSLSMGDDGFRLRFRQRPFGGHRQLAEATPWISARSR